MSSIVPVDGGRAWHVTYRVDGVERTIEVDLITVATGIFSIPRLALDGLDGMNELADVPGLKKSGSSVGKKTSVIHGSELADPETYERVRSAGGNCVVVGFGKSWV